LLTPRRIRIRVRLFYFYVTQVATLKLKRVAKTLFATNCTDFREVEKKSAQISEISGKDFEVFGIVATWVTYYFIFFAFHNSNYVVSF